MTQANELAEDENRGPDRDEIVLPRPEGTSFRIELFRAGRVGSGAAPVLLVQPAMGMQARYYRPLAAALAEAGVQVALAELRGHEASGGRRPGWGYDFGYADMVDDLARAVEAVEAELPGSPIHLLGHSLGGQVSLGYAATHPDRVAGIVLIGSGTVHWRVWHPAMLPLSQAFVGVARLRGHFPGHRVRFAGREARTVLRDWGRFARTGRLPVADDRLDEIDVPVLAISIDGDGLAPARSVDALVAKLPASVVTREHLVAAGIDHNSWARRPEVVVPLLRSWVGTD